MTAVTALNIEPLKSRHWGEILRIQVHPAQKSFVPAPVKVQSQYIFERVDKKPPFEILVIEIEHKVAGFFTLVKDVDDYLWFGGFQLDQAYQNLGLGRQVFERLFAFVAKTPEYAGISLNVQYNNKTIIRFYQRMGLTLVAMMKPGDEPLWLMKIDRESIVQVLKYQQ